jgi:hypothetical protein
MKFGKVFKKIAGAKPTSNYGQRFPLGTHTVLLKNWEIKDTREDSEAGEYFIASSYLVDESTEPKLKKNESREWPWFVDNKGWAGKYALANCQQMSKAILDGFDFSVMPRDEKGFILSPVTNQHYIIDDENDPRNGQPKTEHDISTVSELCEQGFFRGIKLIIKVEPSFNKKTKKPNVNQQTGEQYTDATWKPFPGQTFEMLLAQRAFVDKIDPPDAKDGDEKSVGAAATQNVGGYSVPAGHGGSGMGAFTGQGGAQYAQPASQQNEWPAAFQPPAQTTPVVPAAPAQPKPSTPAAGGMAAMMANLKKPGA